MLHSILLLVVPQHPLSHVRYTESSEIKGKREGEWKAEWSASRLCTKSEDAKKKSNNSDDLSVTFIYNGAVEGYKVGVLRRDKQLRAKKTLQLLCKRLNILGEFSGRGVGRRRQFRKLMLLLLCVKFLT